MADINLNITSNIPKTLEEVTTSVKGLKKDFRAAMDDVANGVQGAAARAGQLKERIKELHETTSTFQGSSLEKLNSSLSLFKEGLVNADPGKLSISMKGLGAAMDAIPIFLIIEGLKLLWDNFDKVSAAFSTSAKKLKVLQDQYDASVVSMAAHSAALQREIDLLSAQGASEEKIVAKKKEKILVEIEEAKASYALATAKILEIQNNDSLYESFLRLSIGISKFMGNEQAAEIQERALAINKKERSAEEVKNQTTAKEALLNAVNNYHIEEAKVETKAGDSKKQYISETQAIILNMIQDQDLKEKALLDLKHKDEYAEAVKQGYDLVSLKEKQAAENLALEHTISERSLIAQKAYYEDLSKKRQAYEQANHDAWIQEGDNRISAQEDAYNKLRANAVTNTANELAADKDNLDKKLASLEANRIQELTEADKTGADKAAINNKYREVEEQATFDHYKKVADTASTYVQAGAKATEDVLTALSSYYATIAAEEVKTQEEALNSQLSALEAEKAGELSVAGLTSAQKDAINKKYAEREYQAKLKAYNSETEIKKKAFEQDKKLKIAQAVISTIAGAVAAFAGAMSLGPIAGPIVGALEAAAVVAAGALQVASIEATTFDAGTPPTPPSINSPDVGSLGDNTNAVKPNFDVFNSTGNGNVNNQNGGSPQVIKAVVIAQEITNVQTQTTYSNNMGSL